MPRNPRSEQEFDHVKEIILVRHAETPHNQAGKVGPFIATPKELLSVGLLPDHEVPLTKRGKSQAAYLGTLLSQYWPDCKKSNVYFDSGYLRTVQTMDAIISRWRLASELRKNRDSHLALREREPGYPFNMTITQVNQYFPWYAEYAKIVGKFYERRPGGESIADVCNRVHMFLNSLRRARQGERVFIVTHGRVMLAFRYWLERRTIRNPEHLVTGPDVKNCEVLIYQRKMDPPERRFEPVLEAPAKILEKFEQKFPTHGDEQSKKKWPHIR